MKKTRGDNYRIYVEERIELEKAAMLSLILERDGRTQTEIASECQKYEHGEGITQSIISEYANEKRAMPERHARVLAHVLGVRPKHLGRKISKELLIKLLDDKAAKILDEKTTLVVLDDNRPEDVVLAGASPSYPATAPVPTGAPVRRDYALAESHGLRVVASIDQAPNLAAIPVWQELAAATGWADNDPGHDARLVWIPADIWKMHGAELRAIEVYGRSMEKWGIEPGDILFVRCGHDVKRAQGRAVIAASEDGMTVKRLAGRALVAESNLDIRPLTIGPDAKLKGVVVAIHKPNK